MNVFKCDERGVESVDGECVAVELDSQAEIARFGKYRLPRSTRTLSEGDGFSLVVIFTQDGEIKRLPGYGSVQTTPDHIAYLNEMRVAVATFVAPPAASTTKTKGKAKPAPVDD